jgi:hypothetical protein
MTLSFSDCRIDSPPALLQIPNGYGRCHSLLWQLSLLIIYNPRNRFCCLMGHELPSEYEGKFQSEIRYPVVAHFAAVREGR